MARKQYGIEMRYAEPVAARMLRLAGDDMTLPVYRWHPWDWYKTEERRDQALEAIQRRSDNGPTWMRAEYRRCYRPSGKAKKMGERGEGNQPRKLTDHKVNECNKAIEITVLDEPGQGGACHKYRLSWPRTVGGEVCGTRESFIFFQNGPIKEVGTNGITEEALLAILLDRMRGFQSGKYACRENAMVATKLDEARLWQLKRTLDRELRGVEGTHEV